MKQKRLIFNFFVNRNWKKLTDSRKRAKIIADNRKSQHPIETLLLLLQILVDAAAGYGLPPSQSFYFLLWASRRLYCHNNNGWHKLDKHLIIGNNINAPWN